MIYKTYDPLLVVLWTLSVSILLNCSLHLLEVPKIMKTSIVYTINYKILVKQMLCFELKSVNIFKKFSYGLS